MCQRAPAVRADVYGEAETPAREGSLDQSLAGCWFLLERNPKGTCPLGRKPDPAVRPGAAILCRTDRVGSPGRDRLVLRHVRKGECSFPPASDPARRTALEVPPDTSTGVCSARDTLRTSVRSRMRTCRLGNRPPSSQSSGWIRRVISTACVPADWATGPRPPN